MSQSNHIEDIPTACRMSTTDLTRIAKVQMCEIKAGAGSKRQLEWCQMGLVWGSYNDAARSEMVSEIASFLIDA